MQKQKEQSGIYILQSLKNNKYYIGSTLNIDNRVAEHNLGKVKATRNLRPWKLRLFYPTSTAREARQLEYKLKRLKSRKIIEKIIENKKITIKQSLHT